MKYVRLVLLLGIIGSVSANAMAQAPICDVTCTPDPTGTTYPGAVAARPKLLNARGFSSPVQVNGGPQQVPMVLGSQSYNYVIPILSLPGRAGMDLNLNLYYNSRVWDVDPINGTATFNADRDFPSYGFRLDFGFIEYDPSFDEYVLTERDGTKHALPNNGGYNTVDGTYINYNTSTKILTYKSGMAIQYEPFPTTANLFRPTQIKDTNGNFIAITYVNLHEQEIQSITDTLGRVVTFHYDGSNQLSYIDQALHPTGVHTYVTFTWGTKYGTGTPWYNFSSSSLSVVGTLPLSTPLKVLLGCTYANNTGYKFTYGDWAIINKIENLNSAGQTRSYVSYDYPPATGAPLTDAPTYTQQTISPDGLTANTSVWNYAATKVGTGVVTAMQVTDPVGSITVTNLDPATGLLSSMQRKDGSGTVLRTTSYLWATSGGANVPDTVTTTLNDTGQQSSVHYSNYDAFGDAADVNEYDFGGQLLRHTVTTYATTFGLQHILGLPTQILVKDGTEAAISRTSFSYDDSGAITINITDAPNHDNSLTVHGNLTSITRYADAAASGGHVTRHLFYDSTGNVRTAELDCCNQKVFNFSLVPYQYAYPDSVVRGPASGPQFTTSATYQFDYGLLATSTDENGQVTSYQYDSMNRLTGVTLPPQGSTSVQLSTVYDDTVVSPTVTRFATPSSVTAPTTVATMDGLGHVLRVDTKNGSSIVSSVTSTYDKLWRSAQSSNPFAPGDTPVYTTFVYDALGRTRQVMPSSGGFTQYDYLGNTVTLTDPAVKQRKNYIDALGRLTEVDEPDPAALGTSSTATLTVNGSLARVPTSGSFPLASASSALKTLATSDGFSHVFYLDSNQHVNHLFSNNNQTWQREDLTTITGSVLAASHSGLFGFPNLVGTTLQVFYVGTNQHIYQYYTSGATWVVQDLTAATGNTLASSTSPLTGFSDSIPNPGTDEHLFYIGANQHIYQLLFSSSTFLWSNSDLTAATGGILAASGSPLSGVYDATMGEYVFYLGPAQHVYQMFWNGTAWANQDLTAATGTIVAGALGGLTSIDVTLPTIGNTLQAFFMASNQHIEQLWFDTRPWAWFGQDLTTTAPYLPGAAGSAMTTISDTLPSMGTAEHLFYLGSDQHIYQMYFSGNTFIWAGEDMTALTGGILASAGSGLASLADGGSNEHVYYVSADQHVHHFWFRTSLWLWVDQDLTGIATPSTADAGIVSLTVGSFTATACYGNSTNPACTGQPVNTYPSDVAAALASALNVSSSPVTATSSQNDLTLSWKIRGPFTVPVSALSTTHDNPATFTSPSFTSAATSIANGAGPLAAGGGFATTYTYDPVGHLTGVSQAAGSGVPGQPRGYVYDSLGRLISSTTPESGTVTNSYTPLSGFTCGAGDPTLVCYTQDARGVVKNFTYDGLNRITGVRYSNISGGADPFNTPPVTYTYDTGGAAAFALNRLTKITEGPATPTPVNSHTFTYDKLGRILTDSQSIDQHTYLIQYAYNLIGEITSITYPSGRVVLQNYDAIGRVCAIGATGSNCTTGTRYLNSPTYNAAGETLSLTLGNGVQGAFTYNDHLQLASLRYFKTSTEILNLSYDYTTGVPGNNGQIQKMHYFTTPGVEDLTKSENFTYDNLGRLSAAQTGVVNSTAGAKTWSLQWVYDRLGNRTGQSMVAGDPTLPVSVSNFAIDPATNRIVGYCYDDAGNLLDDANCPVGNHKYTYDGANRLTKINTSAAVYTYFGPQRIKKVLGSGTTRYIYSGSKPIAEYTGTSSPTLSTEYIYAGSRLLVTIAGSTTTYHHPDHLSNRAETDSSGTRTRTFGHLPYGDTWYEGTPVDKRKFTGYERDSGTGETGLDYAGFRYYASGLGRFMSADFLAGRIRRPQSLNRYAYTQDPVNKVDPLGLDDDDANPDPDAGTPVTALCDANGTCTNQENVVVTPGPDCPPFAACEEGDPSDVGGIGPITPVPVGGSVLGDAAKEVAKKKLDKKDCLDDLKKLGVTADEATAAAAAANFINGVGSTVPLQDLYPPNLKVDGTVGGKLSQSGAVAVASLVGHDIYFNPANIKASDFYFNLGTALHEALHNITGLTDTDMQRALQIKEQDNSENISKKLMKDCF
jgi:RHS repeat-associated protein